MELLKSYFQFFKARKVSRLFFIYFGVLTTLEKTILQAILICRLEKIYRKKSSKMLLYYDSPQQVEVETKGKKLTWRGGFTK